MRPPGESDDERYGGQLAFLNQGVEKEFTDPGPLYYSGGGQFYSPRIMR